MDRYLSVPGGGDAEYKKETHTVKHVSGHVQRRCTAEPKA